MTNARELLGSEFTQQLQSIYGITVSGEVTPLANLKHLDEKQRALAELLRDRLEYLKASSSTERNSAAAALDRLTREEAFTIVNRLAALRMAEKRGFIVESVGCGYQSKGFLVYSQVAGAGLGDSYERYRQYFFCLCDELAMDLGPLFDRRSPAGLLFPREPALLGLLDQLNAHDLEFLWAEDETIGWIYQYYNDETERRRMREESSAPRNSRELAVRNQFFTPRYVVEFLVDNTLGRAWYEKCKGQTRLKDICRYLVISPSECFLPESESVPASLSAREDLLKEPLYIPHRPRKDPRDLKILDPACGSGHFLLYSFDLLEQIYEEAWATEHQVPSEVTGKSIRQDYPNLRALQKAVPELIFRHNLHGIDIDLRACQIAALALWLRAQRAYQRQNLVAAQRPNITRSNLVCAEPMPGEPALLEQFVANLQPKVLGQLIQVVFDKMKLAGEAGVLLKIEEEIAGAVAEAKRLWLAGPTIEQTRFFSENTRADQSLSGFDLSGITDEVFWDRAEAQIYTALQQYAERAENGHGYQRRLFADDAARGFAFIDICRKRYDVVLMNPPFGEWSLTTKSLALSSYPRTKYDIYAAFVERGIQLFDRHSILGAITSRTGFFLSSFQKFREEVLLKEACPSVYADLGHGVLDGAMVEVAAYCLSNRTGKTIFLRALESDDKEQTILRLIREPDNRLQKRFEVDPAAFADIPRSPFAYWTSQRLRALFRQGETVEHDRRIVRIGLTTHDDFRWLRLFWECAPNSGAVPFAKGGSFSKFYADVYLTVLWGTNGALLKISKLERLRMGELTANNSQCWNESLYFRPGITWPRRTDGLSFRVMPKNCIFADKGPAIFAADDDEQKLLALLAVVNSSPFNSLVALQLARTELAQSYEVGLIQRTPYPTLSTKDEKAFSDLSRAAWTAARSIDSVVSTSHSFVAPALLVANGDTLAERAVNWTDRLHRSKDVIAAAQADIDEQAFRIYGLASTDTTGADDTPGIRGSATGSDEDSEQDAADSVVTNVPALLNDFVGYLVGCAFGRWDVRCGISKKRPADPVDPFAPLPTCPPGMLQNEQGLPLTEAECRELSVAGRWDYPLEVPWNGILVDDSETDNDITNRVREVLKVIWKDRADNVEFELCELLKVQSLREYFRRPSLFFADHLKRYSKSRRQAPIYWPVSTTSGRYTLWVYYPRLTAQTLHKCIADFIAPKLKSIAADVQTLRSLNGSQSRLAELLEMQDELNDMQVQIDRINNLPYIPNSNDGVLISASPLWKLFRLPKWQKDLRSCWEELQRGDYDWAHLALPIWPDRVKQKCRGDRSIAMAHNLVDLCEIEEPRPKVKKNRAKQESLLDVGRR